MQVVFRVDASVQIGSGHVMRCLTLAHLLRQNGASVQFICRELPGHLCDLIEQQEFIVHKLPFSIQNSMRDGGRELYEQWLGETWEVDAFQTCEVLRAAETMTDLLIIDHYAIDRKWERQLRKNVTKLMIIDDLANRNHDCDILLDQNLYENMASRYADLLPKHCKQLLGPSYALLRQEFIKAQAYAKVRDGYVRRIFIFFGGSDPTNETEKALDALKLLDRTDLVIDVVVGSSNSNKERIADTCIQMVNTNFYCQINYIAELMVKADLAIGAGGSSTWERCSVGLPTVTVTTAENQVEMTDTVSKVGAAYYLGDHRDVSAHSMAEILEHLMQNPELLMRISRIGMQLMGNLLTKDTNYIAKTILAKVSG